MDSEDKNKTSQEEEKTSQGGGASKGSKKEGENSEGKGEAKQSEMKLNEDGSIPTNYLASTAFASLSSIPFSNLIANPLKACVAAQADCNNAVLKYMQTVAFGSAESTGTASAVKFEFDFLNNGKLNKLSVPLITLVPINYFTIDKIKMQFKASINATNNASSTNQSIEEEISNTKKKAEEQKALQEKADQKKEGDNKKDGDGKKEGEEKKDESTLDKVKNVAKKLMPYVNKLVGGDSEKPAGDNTTYSSKKDSKSTRESKYSVETTIDFEISAVPSDMPAGLSKMLEVLNGTITVINPDGELLITNNEVPKGSKVYITYKNGNGIFSPDDITIEPEAKKEAKADGIMVTFEKAGTFKVTAGKQSGTITVNE